MTTSFEIDISGSQTTEISWRDLVKKDQPVEDTQDSLNDSDDFFSTVVNPEGENSTTNEKTQVDSKETPTLDEGKSKTSDEKQSVEPKKEEEVKPTGGATTPKKKKRNLMEDEPLPTAMKGTNRMTSVIQRIEAAYNRGVDFGYDIDDPFIDDDDVADFNNDDSEDEGDGFMINSNPTDARPTKGKEKKKRKIDNSDKTTKKPKTNTDQKKPPKTEKAPKKEAKTIEIEEPTTKRKRKEVDREIKETIQKKPTTDNNKTVKTEKKSEKKPSKEEVSKEDSKKEKKKKEKKMKEEALMKAVIPDELLKKLESFKSITEEVMATNPKKIPVRIDPQFYKLCVEAKELGCFEPVMLRIHKMLSNWKIAVLKNRFTDLHKGVSRFGFTEAKEKDLLKKWAEISKGESYHLNSTFSDEKKEVMHEVILNRKEFFSCQDCKERVTTGTENHPIDIRKIIKLAAVYLDVPYERVLEIYREMQELKKSATTTKKEEPEKKKPLTERRKHAAASAATQSTSNTVVSENSNSNTADKSTE